MAIAASINRRLHVSTVGHNLHSQPREALWKKGLYRRLYASRTTYTARPQNSSHTKGLAHAEPLRAAGRGGGSNPQRRRHRAEPAWASPAEHGVQRAILGGRSIAV